TSPRPSVTHVVPLMYLSDPNPGASPPPPAPPSPTSLMAEPAAHCSRPKENTLPTAQGASNRVDEGGPKMERNTSRLRPDNALAAARHGIHVERQNNLVRRIRPLTRRGR